MILGLQRHGSLLMMQYEASESLPWDDNLISRADKSPANHPEIKFLGGYFGQSHLVEKGISWK